MHVRRWYASHLDASQIPSHPGWRHCWKRSNLDIPGRGTQIRLCFLCLPDAALKTHMQGTRIGQQAIHLSPALPYVSFAECVSDDSCTALLRHVHNLPCHRRGLHAPECNPELV